MNEFIQNLSYNVGVFILFSSLFFIGAHQNTVDRVSFFFYFNKSKSLTRGTAPFTINYKTLALDGQNRMYLNF